MHQNTPGRVPIVKDNGTYKYRTSPLYTQHNTVVNYRPDTDLSWEIIKMLLKTQKLHEVRVQVSKIGLKIKGKM